MPHKDREERRRYQHERYLADKEAHKARAIASRRRRNAAMRAFLRGAKDRPCADCGVKYPYYVMQFDHLGDKQFSISKIGAGVTIETMRKEIAKCEVVCANCHFERSHQRGYNFELLADEVQPDTASADEPLALF